MAGSFQRWVRDNAFVATAVALPVAVIGLFVLASGLPSWRVPPPEYDLVLAVDIGYSRPGRRVTVDYRVRDGRIEADLRAAPAGSYVAESALYLIGLGALAFRIDREYVRGNRERP